MRPHLPHHRTCRSAYGGSSGARKTPVFLGEAHEAKLAQGRDRNRRIHVAGASVPPRPPGIACAEACVFRGQATAAKLVEPGAVALPLSPQHGGQLPTQPLVQLHLQVIAPCRAHRESAPPVLPAGRSALYARHGHSLGGGSPPGSWSQQPKGSKGETVRSGPKEAGSEPAGRRTETGYEAEPTRASGQRYAKLS